MNQISLHAETVVEQLKKVRDGTVLSFGYEFKDLERLKWIKYDKDKYVITNKGICALSYLENSLRMGDLVGTNGQISRCIE